MDSSFEKLHDLLLNCSNSFDIFCITEAWSTDKDFKKNSNFHLLNFNFVGKKGASILIYLKNDIKFKIIDLSVSDGDNGCAAVETENRNSKYLLITCCYRRPSGAIKGLNSHYLEKVFKKTITENKFYFAVSDFNLNCLDYSENLEIRTFYNRIFAHGCIPLITRPTRVTSKAVPLIDKIFTNFIFGTSL